MSIEKPNFSTEKGQKEDLSNPPLNRDKLDQTLKRLQLIQAIQKVTPQQEEQIKQQKEQAKQSVLLKRIVSVLEKKQAERLLKEKTKAENLILYPNIEKFLKNNQIPNKIIYFNKEELDFLASLDLIDKGFAEKFLEILNLLKEKRNFVLKPEDRKEIKEIENLVLHQCEAIFNLILKNKEKIEKTINQDKLEQLSDFSKRQEEIKQHYENRISKAKLKLKELEKIEEVVEIERARNQELFLDEIKPKIQSLEDRHDFSFRRIMNIIGSDVIIKLIGFEKLSKILNISKHFELKEAIDLVIKNPESAKENYKTLLEVFKNTIVENLTSQERLAQQTTFDVLTSRFEELIVYSTGPRQIKNPKTDQKEKIIPWFNSKDYLEFLNLIEFLSQIIEIKERDIELNVLKLRSETRKLRRETKFAETLIAQLQKGAKISAMSEIKKTVSPKIVPSEFKPKENISPEELLMYTNSFLDKKTNRLQVFTYLYESGIDDSEYKKKAEDFLEKIKELVLKINNIILENKALHLLFGAKTGKRFWEALRQREENDKTGKTQKLIAEKEQEEKRRQDYRMEVEKLKKQAELEGKTFIATNIIVLLENNKKTQITVGALIKTEGNKIILEEIISPDKPDLLRRAGIKKGLVYVEPSIPNWIKNTLKEKK
jgi:hypothetical protein